MKKVITLFVLTLLCVHLISANMQWKTVQIGGGGYVTSIKAHPLVKDLFFITTDVGTPYRWNSKKQAWEGLLYHLPVKDWKRGSAGDLAIDPSDKSGNVIYITLSGDDSTPGTVLKSVDRGDTWTDCQLPIEVWPNSHKGNKRIAVDPQNSNIVYVTTCLGDKASKQNGTFRSNKAGSPGSWTKINNLCGNFIEFDVSKGKISNASKNIYLGCKDGVYLSSDGGDNFVKLKDAPVKPNRSALHRNGTLLVTASTGVYKFQNKKWSNITPPTKGNYSAIAINPNDCSQIVCCSNSFSPYKFNAYRSNNGGKNWEYIQNDSSIVVDLSEAPWYASTIGQNLTEFCWDPFKNGTVWFTDFFFTIQTNDIWKKPYPVWKPRTVGEEETVSTGNLLCPPSGVNVLLTCIADAGGWDHKSLTEPPVVGMQKFFPWKRVSDNTDGWGNISGVAVQESNPNFIVRVGRIGWNGPGYAGYSKDGGESYSQFNIPADVAGGRVAVSATSEVIVWVSQSGHPQRSVDCGKSWTPIASLPAGIIDGENIFATGPVYPLAADKLNGNKFYVYNNSGGMYVSTDAGVTFTLLGKGLPMSEKRKNQTVETSPQKEGDLWVGMISGLFRSTNSGMSFSKIDNVQKADFLAIGKSCPSNPDVPTIYVFGTVNNISGSLFRSTDDGQIWENLGVPAIGTVPLSMTADRQVYGRVFIGTGGNGFFYGDSEN